MKRRQPQAAPGTPALPLDCESVHLLEFENVREFLSATAYEDGTVRVPGYFTLRNRTTAYELTLYDPDAGLRLPCRARTLDEVFALADQLLGADEAPWEVDRYLTEELARRSKKRK